MQDGLLEDTKVLSGEVSEKRKKTEETSEQEARVFLHVHWLADMEYCLSFMQAQFASHNPFWAFIM